MVLKFVANIFEDLHMIYERYSSAPNRDREVKNEPKCSEKYTLLLISVSMKYNENLENATNRMCILFTHAFLES